MRKYIFCLLAVLLFCFGACGHPAAPAASISPPAVEAVVSPTLSPTPSPTPSPSPSPTSSPPPSPEPLPALSPWDGAFDTGTLFIGDSLTCALVTRYLDPNGLLGEASYMTASNTWLTYFFEDWWPLKPLEQNGYTVACSEVFAGLSFSDAVEASAGLYDTIYFFLGTNGSELVTQEDYTLVLDFLLGQYPEATIYVQTLADCQNGLVDTVHANEIIQTVVDGYAEAGESRVLLLDTNSIWDWTCMMSDGVHFQEEGLRRWYDFLAANETCRRGSISKN